MARRRAERSSTPRLSRFASTADSRRQTTCGSCSRLSDRASKPLRTVDKTSWFIRAAGFRSEAGEKRIAECCRGPGCGEGAMLSDKTLSYHAAHNWCSHASGKLAISNNYSHSSRIGQTTHPSGASQPSVYERVPTRHKDCLWSTTSADTPRPRNI